MGAPPAVPSVRAPPSRGERRRLDAGLLPLLPVVTDEAPTAFASTPTSSLPADACLPMTKYESAEAMVRGCGPPPVLPLLLACATTAALLTTVLELGTCEREGGSGSGTAPAHAIAPLPA